MGLRVRAAPLRTRFALPSARAARAGRCTVSGRLEQGGKRVLQCVRGLPTLLCSAPQSTLIRWRRVAHYGDRRRGGADAGSV